MLRIEIQALRALAVLLVLAFHLWPEVVPGGYVGVDVFFAISGFLITAHLVREVERRGRVSLGAFWARRARRLLPASLLVLGCCAVATIAFVPISTWPQFFGDIRASALYVQNWHLAGGAVDYLRSAQAPSPVQHFWSLSAEEQFYAVWPLLIAGAVLVGGRRSKAAIGLVLGAVTVASFAWAQVHTASAPAAAYFVTPARAWEFGLGGLLALVVPVARGEGRRLAAAVSWAGLAAILVAALTFDEGTAFPGVAAVLPVAGGLAVILAGAPRARWAPTRGFGLAPIQRLGDLSYSIYLWHWPLLVLAPFAMQHALDDATKVGVLGTTVALAWLTKVLVEDPFRTGVIVRRPPRWTFAATAAGVAVVLGLSAIGTTHVAAETREAEQRSARTLAAQPRCFGAASQDRRRRCENPALRRVVVPSPVEAQRQTSNARCDRYERGLACTFGAPGGRGGEIAILGDSHAAHWRAALDGVAQRRGWRGYSVAMTSCHFSTRPDPHPEPAHSRCLRWRERVPGFFARHPRVRTVFVSQKADPGAFEAQVAGLLSAWRSLPRSVERIVVLRDVPLTADDTPACIERAMERGRDAGAACAVPRRGHLRRDAAAVAARRLGRERGAVIDLTSLICGRRSCRPVVGGALVYKDDNHLTQTFARTLTPFVDRALDGILRPAAGARPSPPARPR